jgi:outer membrane protein OmpA-like peptidoglycan-associated protein
MKTGYHDDGAAPQSLAALTAALPLEARVQVQNLLADLDAVTDEQGLKMTVPGAELFAIDSERIEPSAHDALAKVAELINVYDGRAVLILGHTDAIGRAGYNQTLSEQRAHLVRQFFVEHFDIDQARLSTRGHGEEQPIASNETVRGRQANRRIEVVILN